VFCYRARSTGGELRTNYENKEIRVFPPDALPELKWTSQQRAVVAWRACKEGRPWVSGRPLDHQPGG
jgi:hypothetical protein